MLGNLTQIHATWSKQHTEIVWRSMAMFLSDFCSLKRTEHQRFFFVHCYADKNVTCLKRRSWNGDGKYYSFLQSETPRVCRPAILADDCTSVHTDSVLFRLNFKVSGTAHTALAFQQHFMCSHCVNVFMIWKWQSNIILLWSYLHRWDHIRGWCKTTA